MLTRSKKRLDYKKFGETGEQTETQLKGEEQVDRDNIGEASELSNLLKSIPISEDLQLVSSEENMSQEKINALSIEESTIADYISDFIDENQVEDMLDASEIDNKISKLKELRTGYRRKHKELKILSGISYEDLYGKSVEKTLMLVKEYTRGGNSFKKELAEKKLLVDLKTEESKRRSELFLEDDVRSTIKSLHSVYNRHK